MCMRTVPKIIHWYFCASSTYPEAGNWGKYMYLLFCVLVCPACCASVFIVASHSAQVCLCICPSVYRCVFGLPLSCPWGLRAGSRGPARTRASAHYLVLQRPVHCCNNSFSPGPPQPDWPRVCCLWRHHFISTVLCSTDIRVRHLPLNHGQG